MKIQSILSPGLVIALVAVLSYYIGVSTRGTNTSYSQGENIEVMSREEFLKQSNSMEDSIRIKEIEVDYEFKRRKIEAYYANIFWELQQNVNAALMKYKAAERAAYARFTEQLNDTVSTSYGNASMPGYASAHKSYEETTSNKAAGAASLAYGNHIRQTNEELDRLMDEYELDFEHYQRRRACAIADLEKEKEVALTEVYNEYVSRHKGPIAKKAEGTVSGILYGEGIPLAVIDGKILREGESIRGVKVVKIEQEHVEFTIDGLRWSQRVNEPPSSNWPSSTSE